MLRKGCKVLCFLEEGRSGMDSSRRGLSGAALALRRRALYWNRGSMLWQGTGQRQMISSGITPKGGEGQRRLLMDFFSPSRCNEMVQ
jgi:hypothetical protein